MAQAPGPITGRSFDVCTNTRSTTRVVCINVRTRGETTWLIAKKGGSSIGTSDLILLFHHYSDVIMGAMVSQITSVSIATVCSGAGAKKISKLRVTDLCKGNSPVTGKFPVQRVSNTENVSMTSSCETALLAMSRMSYPRARKSCQRTRHELSVCDNTHVRRFRHFYAWPCLRISLHHTNIYALFWSLHTVLLGR